MWIDFYKKPPPSGNKGYLSAKKAAVGANLCPAPRIQNFPNYAETGRGRAMDQNGNTSVFMTLSFTFDSLYLDSISGSSSSFLKAS